MTNYAKFNYFEIQSVFTNAKILNLYQKWQAVGVSTDSRTIEKGNIFVALKGENFDGHHKIDEVIQKGAVAAIVSIEWFNSLNFNSLNNSNDLISKDFPLIIVTDTLIALGELAFFHRSRFKFPVIAVAGSNGKTSTKELIHSVLSQKYKTLKTYKNFNNRIGVPLMMLQFSDEYEAAVIEIGTNEPGEISILSQMLQPDYGIITNIGKEHLELLKDLNEVEMEETFLFGQLLKTGGNCFINIDDERLSKYTKVIENNISYGMNETADFTVKIEFTEQLNPIINFTIPYIDKNKTYSAKINSIGFAIALNAIAAAAVGYGLDLTGEEIVKGLESFESSEDGYARMFVQEKGSLKILNDCYNANPSSMEMSLKTLSLFKNADYKIAVLGDMFELGESSHSEHLNVINIAITVANEVLVIGENMKLVAEELLTNNSNLQLKIFEQFQAIADYIKNINHSKVVLVKGSRGMKMENLINII